MVRASRYRPILGYALLLLGFVVGGCAVWVLVPAFTGAARAPTTAPAVKRSATDAARTVQLVDQAVVARTARPPATPPVTPPVTPPTPPEPKPAPQPDVVAPIPAPRAPDVREPDTAPVAPEQAAEVPEYRRLDRPFALRCPTVLNRFDRTTARFEPVAVDAFCSDLRGRYHVIVFWRADEATNGTLKLFEQNAEALARGTPPVDVVFVSSERFPSDLKAFYEAEGAAWSFSTYQGLVDGWLTNYGSQNPDRRFPWLVTIDPERMVLFEGPAMQTAAELKGFQNFLAAMAAARPQPGRADEPKKAESSAATTDKADRAAETPRKDKMVDAATRKAQAPAGAGVAGRREVDYVTLGLQVMRLFPDLAGTPELRQVVKAAEQSLNAKLKKMSPGEANRLAADPPDALVRDAVKAALTSIVK